MWDAASIEAARTTTGGVTRDRVALAAAPRAAKPVDLDDFVLEAIIHEVRARGGDWEDTATNTTRIIRERVPSFVRPALTVHATAWAVNRIKPRLTDARILFKRGRKPDHASRERFVRFTGDKPAEPWGHTPPE